MMSPTTQVPESTTVGIAESETPAFTDVTPNKASASIETLVLVESLDGLRGGGVHRARSS